MNTKVGTKGMSMTLNGQRTQLLLASSFGWLGLLRNRQYTKARKWLRRMKAIGCHGIRVFGEYKDWEHNFFFSQVAPLYDVWDWEVPRGSLVQINKQNARVLRRAVEMLREEDMIMEYVVSATAKALPLFPGFQDHMCRAVAQFFQAEWPRGDHNTYFEISNEYDVTRQVQLTSAEIRDIGRRWRVARPENNGAADNPGALLSISEGGEGAGKWDIEYPVETLSHVNIHSPRGHDWTNVAPEIKRFKSKYRKPICLNENMHFMTHEQWEEWIPQIPGWAGLSTTNAKAVLKQCQNARSAGAAVYCLHFMTGMLTDPDLPITEVERLFQRVYGPEEQALPPIPGPDPIEERLNALEKLIAILLKALKDL